MYNINVELANLCLVPQYIVDEGIYELHSLMKKKILTYYIQFLELYLLVFFSK